MDLIKKYLSNILTAKDNATFSLTKLIGLSGFGSMVYEFIARASVDFIGFAGGVAAIIAALAAKHATEDKNATN